MRNFERPGTRRSRLVLLKAVVTGLSVAMLIIGVALLALDSASAGNLAITIIALTGLTVARLIDPETL